MARYGCLVIAVIAALVVLVFIVYLWSGWLNRPVGRSEPAASAVAGHLTIGVPHLKYLNRHSGESRNDGVTLHRPRTGPG